MSDMSSMSRELKKDQLRRRVISPGGPQRGTPREDSEEIVKQARHTVRRRRVIMALILLVLAVTGVTANYWYKRNYFYKEATVVWERKFERDEAGFVD